MTKEDSAKMQRVTVTLPQELFDALHDIAEDTRVSLSEAFREALNFYLLTERWKSVGEVAKREIKAGKTNQEVLEIVRRECPGASTSLESISWYRSRLRREFPEIPTDRQAREARQSS